MKDHLEGFYRDPDPLLCQGDIVSGIPHIHFKLPLSVLRPAATSRGVLLQSFAYNAAGMGATHAGDPPPGGFKFDRGEGEQVSAFCQAARGVVMTHGCEIDKDSKHRLVAMIRPLGGLSAESQQIIREHRNFSSFYLPPLPGVSDESYVDFRRISCIDPGYINMDQRLASMTEHALEQFLVKFFLFITRADVSAVSGLIGKR